MSFFNEYPWGVTGSARGLRLPKIALGNYSLNIVLQAETCCAQDISTSRWADGGALGLMSTGSRSNNQKRVGLLGTQDEALVGLFNRGAPIGPIGPLDMGPTIVGFVHRDGFLTVYKDSVEIGTYVAISNAITTFEWVNGWLDERIGGSGQIAEVKLYKQPFTSDVMKKLQDNLACKWGIDNSEQWKDCRLAQPLRPDSSTPNHPGYTVWPIDSDVMVADLLVPRLSVAAFRDYVAEEEDRPQILALTSSRPYVMLYLLDPLNTPFSVSQQPEWTGDGDIMGWEELEPLLIPSGFPEDQIVPGMSLFVPATDTSTATAEADGEEYTYVHKVREVRVTHKQSYSAGVTDFTPLLGNAFPIVPASFPGLTYDWEVTMEGLSEHVPTTVTGPEWSGSFTSTATGCVTGMTCENLCIQVSAGHLNFVLPTTTSSTDPIEFQPFDGPGSDTFTPETITTNFNMALYVEHDRAKDIGTPCVEEIGSSTLSIPTPLFNIRFVGGTNNGENIGYPSAMPTLPNPPVQVL